MNTKKARQIAGLQGQEAELQIRGRCLLGDHPSSVSIWRKDDEGTTAVCGACGVIKYDDRKCGEETK